MKGSLMKLFNISNHSSEKWNDKQKKGWDEIVDIPQFYKVEKNLIPSRVGLCNHMPCEVKKGLKAVGLVSRSFLFLIK